MSQIKAKAKLPDPPAHLSAAAKDWWIQVTGDYILEEHHLKILTHAAECWDRQEEARKLIAKKGLTYEDRFGAPHARPEVGIARDCMLTFARLMRELALDVEPPAAARVPRGAAYGGVR